MLSHLARSFQDAVLDTDHERALAVVEDALVAGVSAEDAASGIVLPSMDDILNAVAGGVEVSLAQHFIAAKICSVVMERLLPRFSRQPERLGRVVIGTSAGDFHALGKSIVAGYLRAQLVDVIDLGLSIPASHFVAEAVAQSCQVIAISSMMLHTARGEHGCLEVRRLLRERSLEAQIKVIVGGAPYRFDPELYHTVEADAWGATALDAVPVVKRLLGEVHKP